MTHKVPVQSLIDHIKTAIDVDPWAKEMVEELLKEQEAKEQLSDAVHETAKQFRQTIVRCKDCKWWHESKTNNGFGDCGQANGITLKPSDWFCADGERK